MWRPRCRLWFSVGSIPRWRSRGSFLAPICCRRVRLSSSKRHFLRPKPCRLRRTPLGPPPRRRGQASFRTSCSFSLIRPPSGTVFCLALDQSIKELETCQVVPTNVGVPRRLDRTSRRNDIGGGVATRFKHRSRGTQKHHD